MYVTLCFCVAMLGAEPPARPAPASRPARLPGAPSKLAPTTRSLEELRAMTTQPTADLRVDVIEAKLPEPVAEALDVSHIAPPDHAVDKLLAKLRESGTAKLIIRNTQPVILAGQLVRLSSGQQVPFVMGQNRYAGQVQRSIGYQDVGAILFLQTSPWQQGPDGKKVCALSGHIEYSGIVDSSVEITSDDQDGPVPAPIFVKTVTDQAVTLRSGEPALISTMKRVAEPKGKPAEYIAVIVRIEITAP